VSTFYEPPTLSVPVTADDWRAGSLDAPVIFVEYGDFECPHCGQVEPILRELREQMGADLCFVFRHFALTSSHPHAEAAAEAAEAAGCQGAFWPMHDALFANQEALDRKDLLAYATDLGLDAERVASELEQRIHESAVRSDFISGVRSGVAGTPTFFINDARYDREYTLDALLRATRKAARLAR
jgi:protein-disulfide isomerase